MKRKINKVHSLVYLLATAIFALVQIFALRPTPVSAAASASMYLSPSTATIVKGKTIIIKVYENSGSTNVNAVKVNLTYSTSKLSYVSYSSASSAFPIEAQNPSGNSSPLTFVRATAPPFKTGAQLVVTVTFKAVASSGTTSVLIGSGSTVNSADGFGTNILTSTSGGSYTLKAPATSPPVTSTKPNPPPTTSSSSTSTSSSHPTTKKDTSAPKISEIIVSKITANGAFISWKTSEASTSVVKWGLDTKHQIAVSDTNLVTSHKIALNLGPENTAADQTYHFSVISTDKAGNSATSKDIVFQSQPAVVPTATAPTPNPTSNKVKIAAGVAVVSLAALAIVGANMIKRRHEAAAELERHFVNTTGEPLSQPPAPTVIESNKTAPIDKETK